LSEDYLVTTVEVMLALSYLDTANDFYFELVSFPKVNS